jgi:hypothetical protein
LDAIRAGNTSIPDLDVITARQISKFAVCWYFFQSSLFTFMGIGWKFEGPSFVASVLLYTYFGFRAFWY